jgi:DNA-binding transcriptional LysR family regulator
VQVTPPCPLTSNDPATLLRAARDGLGLVITFEGYVTEAIAAGTLLPVLDDWCQPFPGPFLYYPSRRQPPAALAAFVAFVGEWRKVH